MFPHSHRLKFGDLPEEYSTYDRSRIVLLPVPFDLTSTWIKGADRGPEALLDASANLELYDIETDSEVWKQGIFTNDSIEAENSETMVQFVYTHTRRAIGDEKFVVTIGGEHSVSIGTIQAHLEKYSRLSVLHFDAHTDSRDSYLGSPFNHACVMARVQEMTQQTVSVGIRSMDSSEWKNVKRENVFFAENILGNDPEWIDRIVKKLSPEVYVTIDLDVFDPSIMPSTGTPEPGGLDWYDVTKLLKKVSAIKTIIGFDLVELCPNPADRAPDFLAAKLLYKILSYRFYQDQ